MSFAPRVALTSRSADRLRAKQVAALTRAPALHNNNTNPPAHNNKNKRRTKNWQEKKRRTHAARRRPCLVRGQSVSTTTFGEGERGNAGRTSDVRQGVRGRRRGRRTASVRTGRGSRQKGGRERAGQGITPKHPRRVFVKF